mmetsp:Transcript_39927/g.76545  ORF Transcript_39927/g.76545 Transcript_39927/m.76545 type:complete len:229 (+) Transcript_39927:487-1173(+)
MLRATCLIMLSRSTISARNLRVMASSTELSLLTCVSASAESFFTNLSASACAARKCSTSFDNSSTRQPASVGLRISSNSLISSCTLVSAASAALLPCSWSSLMRASATASSDIASALSLVAFSPICSCISAFRRSNSFFSSSRRAEAAAATAVFSCKLCDFSVRSLVSRATSLVNEDTFLCASVQSCFHLSSSTASMADSLDMFSSCEESSWMCASRTATSSLPLRRS